MIIILSEKRQQKNFKKELTYLGENTEKYITFTVPIEEEEVTRIDKNGKEITKNLSNILFAKFMASSSSGLVNNLF